MQTITLDFHFVSQRQQFIRNLFNHPVETIRSKIISVKGSQNIKNGCLNLTVVSEVVYPLYPESGGLSKMIP